MKDKLRNIIKGTPFHLILIAVIDIILVCWISDYISPAWTGLILLGALTALSWKKLISGRIAVAYCTPALSHFADPSFGWGIAVWFMVIPMFILLREIKSRREAFGYGQWIGTMIAAGVFSWLYSAMHIFFEVPALYALLFFIITISITGLQIALFFLLTYLLMKKINIPLGILGAVLYVLVEFWIPLPFPMKLAMAFNRSPLFIQIADLAGITGITLFIALINGLIYTIWRSWRENGLRRACPWAAALIAVLVFQMGYGWLRMAQFQPAPGDDVLDVAMIQPLSPLKIDNADNETKDSVARNLVRLSRQVVTESDELPDLLIWPEGASSFSYRTPGFNSEYMEQLSQFQKEFKVNLVLQDIEFVKMPFTGKLRYYGAITLVDPRGKVLDSYRKIILLPFAEYLPGEKTFPFLRKIFPQARSVLKGKERTLINGPQGPFVPLICYEVVFGSHVRRFVKEGRDARYMINLTNDRWYGPRQQPEQHLTFSVFRAVENRMPVIRSTNSGISALVDARGVIRPEDRTRVMRETTLRGKIYPKKKQGITIFCLLGDILPRWILPIAVILAIFRLFPFSTKKRARN
jgi:apolipoprotein N-acyltransferase